MTLRKKAVILFQGDSITDCGWNRSAGGPNESLGNGYAYFASTALRLDHPKQDLQFLNRGISGNRIVDFYARLSEDVINLKPEVLSILLGVNDTWHRFSRNAGVPLEKFAGVYAQALTEIKVALPKIRLVLCEPFVLRCGVVKKDWITEMDERRAIVKKLAGDFSAVFVPFQGMFDAALKSAPAEYWAPDGVHPSPAGHLLMARTWIDTVKLF